jgi:hypothetical protein
LKTNCITSKEIRMRINLNGVGSNYAPCETYIHTSYCTIRRVHYQIIVDSIIYGKVVVLCDGSKMTACGELTISQEDRIESILTIVDSLV